MVAKVWKLSWQDVETAVNMIVEQARRSHDGWNTVVAVSRGGLVPARLVAAKLGVTNMVLWDVNHGVLGKIRGPILVVDDIVDSGRTSCAAKDIFGGDFAAIVSKVFAEEINYIGIKMDYEDKRWVVFPWEGKADLEGVRQSNE